MTRDPNQTTARREFTADLKRRAVRAGFALSGVCPAAGPSTIDRFRRWLDAGYAGRMEYMRRRADAYGHPNHVLDGAASIVMLAMPYHSGERVDPVESGAVVSRYAFSGTDYHDVIHRRLGRLEAFVLDRYPRARVRGVVDTAPILERDFARQAGLGWFGKNTMLLNRRLGSWFFLAALLTDVELEYDRPFETGHCGSCRACLDACPTGALREPFVLDARRCISYLTIESPAQIPRAHRAAVGGWVFGCDACQDVCPWNRRAKAAREATFEPADELNPIDAAGLFQLDDASFKDRFRRTPLWRPKRRGILRNAAIVLGNRPQAGAVEALSHGLADEEPIVRAACAWALGRYPRQQTRSTLEARLAIETDESVRTEIREALDGV